MKSRIIMTIIGVIIAHYSNSQNRMDSLVQSRNTDFIAGKVPTYYTPSHKKIALRYQRLITDAITYYERKYSKTFDVKLAVIDSSQWLNEVYSFGFVFYTDGWIAMNTGMSYESFKEVYGLHTYYQQLNKVLKSREIGTSQLIDSFFGFYALHELGHYFIDELSDAKTPDNWTSEFAASYFAYEYFANNQPDALIPFELFCQVDRDHYRPRYSTIADFNEKYAGTGLENYVWYHSNFYFLVKELYGCRGKEFISSFEREFERGSEREFTTDEIIQKLDKNCNGLVARWLNNLESKTK